MELFHAAFLPANFLFTILLMVMMFYWAMVIIGTLDLEFLDFDLDTDAELDVDVDVDVDGDIDPGLEAGFFDGFLSFFYFGKIPVMILLSIIVVCMWCISIVANDFLNPSGSLLLGLPIAVGTVVVSPFVCKVICMPLARFFAMFKKDYNAPRDVIGRICKITTTKVSSKMGQAEVSTGGAPIVLNVISEGGHVFNKGDEAIVISKDNEKGVYVVAPVNLED